jgi:hypothetical protein
MGRYDLRATSYRVRCCRLPRDTPRPSICKSLRGVPQISLAQKAQNAMPHDQGALIWRGIRKMRPTKDLIPHGSRDKNETPGSESKGGRHKFHLGAARSEPCFGGLGFCAGGLGSQIIPSGVPKSAPRAELAAFSDRTKAQQQRESLGSIAYRLIRARRAATLGCVVIDIGCSSFGRSLHLHTASELGSKLCSTIPN